MAMTKEERIQKKISRTLVDCQEKPFPGVEKLVLPHCTKDGVERAMEMRARLAEALLRRHLLVTRCGPDIRDGDTLEVYNTLCFAVNTLTEELK